MQNEISLDEALDILLTKGVKVVTKDINIDLFTCIHLCF